MNKQFEKNIGNFQIKSEVGITFSANFMVVVLIVN